MGLFRVLPVFAMLLLAPAFGQDAMPPVPKPRPVEQAKTIDPIVPETQNPAATPEVAAPIAGGVLPAPLPRPRPDPAAKPAPIEAPVVDRPDAAKEGEPEKVEPPRIYQTACPAVLTGMVEATALPPISEGQCGTQSPLSITGVFSNGRLIPFTSAATLDCGMATALPNWVGAVDSYLMARDNTGIESVIVGTSYMCRNVNNGNAGRLSEHSFAGALDVVGFKLQDGRTITVLEGWPGTEAQGSRIVRYAHDAACSLFTTTLGPEANAQHHDHLHIDLGCHGQSCTARMCE